MANAIKCDLCGKFCAIEDIGYAEMILMKYRRNGTLAEKNCYDVCKECLGRILQKRGEESKEVTCATCGVSDLNCREQCRER